MATTLANAMHIIIPLVLSRLPVKSLLRFKCVCKSWRNLIENADFIKSHHENQSIETNSIIFYLSNSFYIFPQAIEFKFPKEFGYNIINFVGTCNGLICVQLKNHDFMLCNPSTRRFQRVAPKSETLKGIYLKRYGFGYDSQCDDYKIFEKLENNEVLIYSLKSDSWSRAERLDESYYLDTFNGVFLNNCLHWICSNKKGLISFDLHNQTWGRIMLLPYSVMNNYTYVVDDEIYEKKLKLSVFYGCLCLSTSFSAEDPDNVSLFADLLDHVEIWVMKEYGIEESWTKLPISYSGPFPTQEFSFPLKYFEKQKEVLFSKVYRHGLFCYNLMRETIQEVVVPGNHSYNSEINLYAESLVPLLGDHKLQGKVVLEDKDALISRAKYFHDQNKIMYKNYCSTIKLYEEIVPLMSNYKQQEEVLKTIMGPVESQSMEDEGKEMFGFLIDEL